MKTLILVFLACFLVQDSFAQRVYYNSSMQTHIKEDDGAITPLPSNYWVNHAIKEIRDTFGDEVRVKSKSLRKFGRNNSLTTDTPATVQVNYNNEVNETYVDSNLITHVASSSASDTEEIVIEGHTISGGVFTFVTQTLNLVGQTKTALATPLARVTRLYNNDSTLLVGNIAVAEDITFTSGVPDVAADSQVHLYVPAGKQQSEKASTTISNTDYYFVTQVGVCASRGSGTANVDVELEIRLAGKIFRPVGLEKTIRTNGTGCTRIPLRPFVIVPKNADVRLIATSSAAATAAGFFDGILAAIQ